METIIDSHVHLDLIARHHPRRLQWLRQNSCSVVSWSFFEGIGSVAELKNGLADKARCLHTQAADGLQCHYLAGVHPRSIPPDLKPEQIAALLGPYLEDPLCRGVGEVGLETGSTREQEVLVAQLEIGRNVTGNGKVIGVHTPRSNKPVISDITLKLLEDFSDLGPSLVIDHCTEVTIRDVLEAGFRAGVTLSPPKTSWEEMKRIVSLCSDHVDRIMCNTDSGEMFFEDIVRFNRSDDLSATIRRKLFHDNAGRFFGLDP